MFRNMKPLPKAIIIGVIVGLPIWAYTQFAPKSEVKPVVQEEVKAESQPAVVQEESTPKISNVTSGAAGMDAVLKAGKK